MLDKLKLKLGIIGSESDDLLNLLLDDAQQLVMDYCNRSTVPQELYSVVVKLAVIAYNKQGIEGEQSHSEGSVSRSFGTDDIPASLQRQLNRYRLGTVKLL